MFSRMITAFLPSSILLLCSIFSSKPGELRVVSGFFWCLTCLIAANFCL